MAEEQVVEQTTEQESPTVEEKQPEAEAAESAEKPEETPEAEAEGQPEPEDKNWKALREEKKRLEKKLAEYEKKDTGTTELGEAKDSPAVKPFLSVEDSMNLKFNEMQAISKIDSLDPGSDSYDELFDMAVSGKYRAELDKYSKNLIAGAPAKLPDAYAIAKTIRKDWDSKLEAKKQATAEKKQKAVETKQAMAEAEGRSDKREPTDEEKQVLAERSRRGDYDAVAERLARSGL